jgi:AbiV family abortive infection protein
MSDPRRKRRYRNNLDFVEAGLCACWRNANELVAASKNLIDRGQHAPALSLSVLALEELGKMCAIDGLVFARSNDDKAQRFDKSLRGHDVKLAALQLLPLFIGNLSLVDPRRASDPAYSQALATSLHMLQDDGNAVLQLIQEEDFTGLDRWKQRGFYVGINQSVFVCPREAIDKKHAETVHHFAWRAVTTFDFVLGHGMLKRYIEQARSRRSKLAEDHHTSLEQVGQRIANILFGTDDASDSDNRP